MSYVRRPRLEAAVYHVSVGGFSLIFPISVLCSLFAPICFSAGSGVRVRFSFFFKITPYYILPSIMSLPHSVAFAVSRYLPLFVALVFLFVHCLLETLIPYPARRGCFCSQVLFCIISVLVHVHRLLISRLWKFENRF